MGDLRRGNSGERTRAVRHLAQRSEVFSVQTLQNERRDHNRFEGIELARQQVTRGRHLQSLNIVQLDGADVNQHHLYTSHLGVSREGFRGDSFAPQPLFGTLAHL